MQHEHEYHRLAVIEVIDETADTRSFVLDVPPALEATFAYTAGQFCTFRATIDGESVVRSLLDVELARRRRTAHHDRETRPRRPDVELDERPCRRGRRGST